MARQSSAKASTPVRIWSGPLKTNKLVVKTGFFYTLMSKTAIIFWLGLVAAAVLVAACFMPWTYHADVQKDFTGFFSAKDKYGKPGKFILIFTGIIVLFMLLPKLWAKRINLFLGAVLVAYAFRTYVLYTSCYMAYCPEKKAGIYLMLCASVVVFIATFFPNMKLPAAQEKA